MEYSIDDWVENASEERKDFSQAVHIILEAISSSEYLKPKMIMKGGMLLGIRYQSSRFTEDIDFSTSEKLSDINEDEFTKELNESLQIAADTLPYSMKCAVQKIEVKPKDEDATFPSFKLKIGYANLNNKNAMRRLEKGQSANTVKIDYSFNEMTYKTDEIKLEGDESVQAYSITDLLAEKIRSIIQQPYRKRNRRQDVYDLHYLLNTIEELNSEEKFNILDTLFKKSQGRVPLEDITPQTLDRDDIRKMSEKAYPLLEREVEHGTLPEFEVAYDTIVSFYKSLPWDCINITPEPELTC
jgi:predicted nucleotidyltransferase component of viral defense system